MTDTPTLSEALEAVIACEKDATPVTLLDCPVGLFMAGDELCLKTEYGSNEGSIDAYIVSSGEFFWGSAPQTIASQRQQLVVPVDLAASANLSRHAPAIKAMVEENERLRAALATWERVCEAEAKRYAQRARSAEQSDNDEEVMWNDAAYGALMNLPALVSMTIDRTALKDPRHG